MKTLTFSLGLIAASLISTTAFAAADESKMFGAAAPFTIDKLPGSKLKSRLEQLPAPAKARALKWLHRFDFPANDVEFINVDNNGGVFYQDTTLPDAITQTDLEADPTLEGINPTDAFKLHSKPGAANVVYVNFKGYTISGTAWNDSVSSYQAKPFNKDSDSSTFSTAERTDIAEIWHRIAEDLAPFDIDVTTEMPASFGPTVGHILITSKTTATGAAMPHDTSGGVAYVGVWGESYYASYQPALVYYDNLASAPYYIAEAASHELGHNLALSHDGTSSAGYYQGHGTGLSSWGPVMGVGYYTNVTQWSKGEYSGANNTQDDLAIISQRLQYRADDHGNNQASATALLVDGNGYLASSNPEFDPLSVRPDNKGIIETSTDSDVFYFDTASGNINLVINPAWDAYTRTNKRGANLDIKATLTDGNGTNIVDDTLTDTNAVISANVTAGRYYLEITGVGNAAIPYSDYGSLGQYHISGTVIPASLDQTAPTPDPLFWEYAPSAVSKTSISMTSTLATDISGIVEYQFLCTTGGLGCVASSWQTEQTYMASGLAANTSYTYQVKARDASGNETGLSPSATTSTLSNIVPEAVNDVDLVVNKNTPTTLDVLSNDSDADGDAIQLDSASTPSHGDVAISNNTLIYTPDANYTGADSFTYTITDGVDQSAPATVDITIIAVNAPPVAGTDSAEVLLRGSVDIDVLTNDSDQEGSPLSIISVTDGSKGATAINGDKITYTVNGSSRGGDSFSYVVSDGELTSTGIVNISIVRKLSGDGGGGSTGSGSGKCNPKKGC